MYRPKFCAECSAKIIRLRWHFWTSRRFCGRCAPRFLKNRLTRPGLVVGTIFLLGMAAGHAARRMPPPVVIERAPNSTSTSEASQGNGAGAVQSNSRVVHAGNITSAATTAEIYECGARTRKGTPCTRRVHGPVRCWQHLGLPAMRPQEQLRIQSP